jgi:hypothetical protein
MSADEPTSLPAALSRLSRCGETETADTKHAEALISVTPSRLSRFEDRGENAISETENGFAQSRLSRNAPTTEAVVYTERDKRDSRVEHRVESLSLYLPDLLYVSRVRVTFVTLTALRAASEASRLNNQKAHASLRNWLLARLEMRGRWTRASSVLWRRRKQLIRRRRAARAAQ